MPLFLLEEIDEQVNMSVIDCDKYNEGNKQDDEIENKKRGQRRGRKNFELDHNGVSL